MAKSLILDVLGTELTAPKPKSIPDKVSYPDRGNTRTLVLTDLDVYKRTSIKYKYIEKLKVQLLDNIRSEQYSQAKNLYLAARHYLQYLNRKGIDPLSKAGYRSYFSRKGYLWTLVDYGKRTKAHRFMYEDGEPLGIAEKTAADKKRLLKGYFDSVGLDVFAWDKGVKQFSLGGLPKKPTLPYSPREHTELIQKLNEMFFIIAPLLISEYKGDTSFSNSTEFTHKLVMDSLGSVNTPSGLSMLCLRNKTPRALFSFCMEIAYYIFCHYTSFNDSVVARVCRPICITKSGVEGKTSKFARITAYKGRGNKFVQSILSNEIANHEGELEASIDKRNGIAFLLMLQQLSATFNPDEKGLLIYDLDEDGEVVELTIRSDHDEVARELELFADIRVSLIERLSEALTELVQHNRVQTSKKTLTDEHYVIKHETKYYQENTNQRTLTVHRIAAAFLQCMTNDSLRTATIPLSYSDKDENNIVTVTCKDTDDKTITLRVPVQHVDAVKLIEELAFNKNPPYRLSRKPEKYTRELIDFLGTEEAKSLIRPNKRSAYLLPKGRQHETTSYNMHPVDTELLSMLGISTSYFFISLNSRRIRLTNADNEYLQGNEYSARLMLQNSKGVFESRYANGHPGLNNEITAQSIQILEEIAKGADLEMAKDIVRQDWKVDVLTFEEYLARGEPKTNPNGTHCNGKPDFLGKEHKLAEAQAKKMKVTEGDDLTCFQYDKCYECGSCKLVEHPYQIYKYISFLDSLTDTIDNNPANVDELEERLDGLERVLQENISEEVIEQALKIMEENGRYFLFA
ncbi:hypothetical protein [Vibrio aestuarianus]|uniref:hypothetical protein n=3 Tax=Vibrio aestuarianus TaxID=28171 RepID=UPI001455EDA7|nr:hypothetical protein [Vibrio aestuarianus]MDE1227336.1 hypothetical protein [Vibrio aestuarianus]MDE1269974.1 hypothetical protein [Vibrio aestuarianus]MDE1291488.1 hypothetical protein [Vibrio aestuarianus]MDE1305512.1 hypothetical protein [Vibrio aestuarianus]MDH5890226.1 hypothetical protein [Vibrio aestuarianus]